MGRIQGPFNPLQTPMDGPTGSFNWALPPCFSPQPFERSKLKSAWVGTLFTCLSRVSAHCVPQLEAVGKVL